MITRALRWGGNGRANFFEGYGVFVERQLFARLSSEAPLPPDTEAHVDVIWVCQDDDSNPDSN